MVHNAHHLKAWFKERGKNTGPIIKAKEEAGL